MKNLEFETIGWSHERSAFPSKLIDDVADELGTIGSNLVSEDNVKYENVDQIWNHLKSSNRALGGTLYNGFKHLQAIKRLGSSKEMHEILGSLCGVRQPALIDINCRIDSNGEEKFLFDWHQDYWFSICSPNSVVVWIPITKLEPSMGGLQIISNSHTGGRIFRTKAGTQYRSYADAITLDEELPQCKINVVDDMDVGDALFFKFNVLHKSIPIRSTQRSRFTVQLRFADFSDPEFVSQGYRPGTVNSQSIDYINKKSK